MPCAAQRNNVWELAVLIFGLLSLARIVTASECKESFYRNTLPQWVTQSGLEWRCHSLDAGRTFASLSHPEHQSHIYTALHLGQHNAWGKGTTEELDEARVLGHIPALYKKDQDGASSPSASTFYKLDVLTAELVKSQIMPQCSKAGGSVYVQSGVGGLSETKADVLWSAVCCDVPEGAGSFSTGVVLEGEGEMKLMSVKEMEELMDINELFSGGCGETLLEDEALEVSEVSHMAETDKSSDENEVSVEQVTKERIEERTRSEPNPEGSNEEISESQEESVVLYVLSSTISLLFAPLCPVVSTITNLPSQICYVLQEDAAVLAALPGDSLSLVQNMGYGVVSGVENVGSIVYQVSEHGVCSLYTLISTLSGTLVLSCQEGLAGTGTLMGDALGLGTGALGEVWGFGTEVVESMSLGFCGYLSGVGSEIGEQGMSIGKGLGRLVWRGQRGLGHVINIAVGVVGGMFGNVIENIQEAFTEG